MSDKKGYSSPGFLDRSIITMRTGARLARAVRVFLVGLLSMMPMVIKPARAARVSSAA